MLCSAGPSLNKFVPIKDAVYLAINRAVLYEKVKFDYINPVGLKGLFKDVYQEKNENIVE